MESISADMVATRTGNCCELYCDRDRGEYLRVTPETCATGLAEILQQLHGRYELGFKSETLDGKPHKLNVKLADAVAAIVVQRAIERGRTGV